MGDTGEYPKLFRPDFRVVKPVDHLHGNDRVFVAVDEQHRQPASAHGIERRGLPETPPVEEPAPKVRQLEEWKERQPGLFFP